jgi:hypothetical protein
MPKQAQAVGNELPYGSICERAGSVCAEYIPRTWIIVFQTPIPVICTSCVLDSMIFARLYRLIAKFRVQYKQI